LSRKLALRQEEAGVEAGGGAENCLQIEHERLAAHLIDGVDAGYFAVV